MGPRFQTETHKSRILATTANFAVGKRQLSLTDFISCRELANYANISSASWLKLLSRTGFLLSPAGPF